ncbi:MAG: phosphatase PAP2 family protein, partial [Clostridia bacterium]|nr:phosphatase PAP2 family protein [Clostridia bacterium]
MAIQYVDVLPIGPRNSEVGFATVNGYFHNLTGTHMLIYTITDWLGLVPLFVMLGFAILGLVQLVKRKNLFKVDLDILALGGFYIIVFAAYLLFEVFVINYRPVLIDGYLEASYPSSTTLLVMCVMPTAIMQLNKRIKKEKERKVVTYIILAFTVFMVIGRLISGVHWLTDIIGGVLLSGSLVMFYYSVKKLTVRGCVNTIYEAKNH